MLSNCGLDKTLESPLDCKEIQPVHPKGNQPRIFIERTDAEAEAPILWPPDADSWLIGKDPDTGKDWGQEEKRVTEDEMVGWHHQLNGHESEQTPGDSRGQRSLLAAVHGVAKNQTQLSDWTTKRLDEIKDLNYYTEIILLAEENELHFLEKCWWKRTAWPQTRHLSGTCCLLKFSQILNFTL